MKKYILFFLLLWLSISAFSQDLTITGSVLNEDGVGICNALVQLSGQSEIQTILTNEDGSYQFENLNVGSDYTVQVKKDDDLLNGISTFDLVLLSKHILGTQEIQNPYILYSLDIDSSSFVSVKDMVIMRRIILSIDNDIPRESWQFFVNGAQFSDPQNPWESQIERFATFNDLDVSVNNIDFVGYKTGDTNKSAVPCSN